MRVFTCFVSVVLHLVLFFLRCFETDVSSFCDALAFRSKYLSDLMKNTNEFVSCSTIFHYP